MKVEIEIPDEVVELCRAQARQFNQPLPDYLAGAAIFQSLCWTAGSFPDPVMASMVCLPSGIVVTMTPAAAGDPGAAAAGE